MADWGTAMAVGEQQHFVWATWQLVILNVSKHAVFDRVRVQRWSHPYRGVVAMPGEDTRERQLAAAVLAFSRAPGGRTRMMKAIEEGHSQAEALVRAALRCGQSICGPPALWLHGVGEWSGSPWLRLPRGGGSATRSGISIRHGAPSGEIQWVRGLPVVDIEQAILDIPGCNRASTATGIHYLLTRAISTAHARRLTSPNRVAQRLEELGNIYGANPVRAALDDLAGEMTHSGREHRAREIVEPIVRRYGLTLHPQPMTVLLEGVRVGEADLPIVEIRLDIEVDGPHHRLPAQVAADQDRDRRMRRADWEVERFSTELLDTSPRQFGAKVDEAIRSRLQHLQTRVGSR